MKHELFITANSEQLDPVIPLPRGRMSVAKRAFTTRRVDLDLAVGLITAAAPRAGDILLAQVVRIGQHQRLEDPHGRRSAMYEGDHIIVAYGDRYAPDQFEAHVPETLGACDLVAGGGVASGVIAKSDKVRAATRIQPVGILTDGTGRRLNTADFAVPVQQDAENSKAKTHKIIAVVGSSMNAGKTTAMAALVQGERRAGRRVAALKITGTGSGGDMWSYHDAGANICLDFTDAGHATTHRLTDDERIDILERLVARARSMPDLDTIVIEVADGLLFGETERLVLDPAFRSTVDAVVYAAADAMGALSGAEWLLQNGLPLRALSGAFTASPIGIAEVASRSSLPVLQREALIDGAFAQFLA